MRIRLAAKLLLSMAIVFSVLQPAAANNLPGPWPVLILQIFLMAPLGVIITAGSGGYKVIDRRKQLKIGWTVPLAVKVLAAIVLIPLVVCWVGWIPIAIWSVVRALQLIRWGIARNKQQPDASEFLSDTNGNRLLLSGVILLALTVAMSASQFELMRSIYASSNIGQIQEQIQRLNQAQQ